MNWNKEIKIRWDLLPRLELFLALFASLFAIILHFIFMSHAGGLWRDESSSFNLATMPSLADLWKHLLFDSFPVLWPLLLRSWVALGFGGDMGLRVLGLFTGLFLMCCIWFCSRCFGIKFPGISLFLFALCPIVIIFGDSMRARGLGAAMILLTYGSTWKAAQSSSRRNVLISLLFSILSVHISYHNVPLLFAIISGGCCVCLRRKKWRQFLLLGAIGAIAAVSLLPYMPIIREGQLHYSNLRVVYDFDDYQEKLLGAMSGESYFGRQFMDSGFWVAPIICALLLAILSFSFPSKLKIPASNADLALFVFVTMVAGVAVFYLFLHHLGYVTQCWYYIGLLGLLSLSLEAIFSTLKPLPGMDFCLQVFLLFLFSDLAPEAYAP